MTTPAMLELPEPELGYIETDKSRQPAFSARQMREALQSQPAAAVSDEEIWGLWDSQERTGLVGGPCPVKFARAILALRPQAVHPDTARCIKARNDLNAALHGEGALIDDLEHAVANACAKLLRPQAVPMTRAQRLEVFRKAEDRMAHDINLCWRNALIEETEAHHGITQRADGGEVE